MTYFVIEHKTKGYYTGREYELKEKDYEWVPHFAWSVSARHDRVTKMFSDAEVKRELSKMPPKIRLNCVVRELKT